MGYRLLPRGSTTIDRVNPPGEQPGLGELFTHRQLGVLVVLALAAVLRVMLVDRQSAWLDEGLSLQDAQLGLRGVLHLATSGDPHPPLYYLALHGWLRLTGFSIVQARVPSVLCGIAAVLVIYSLSELLFDRATALCAALFLAVSPVATWYSDQIRMYAPAALFALLAIYALVRASQQGHWWLWLVYAIATALALSTDYSSAYVLCGLALYYLWAVAIDHAPLKPWLVANAILGVLLLPLAAIFIRQAPHSAAWISWIPATTPPIIWQVWLDLISLNAGQPVLIAMVGGGLTVLAVLAMVRDPRRLAGPRPNVLLPCIVLAPLVIPLLFSLLHPIFLLRTVMMADYGLLILFARGAVVLMRWRWGAGLLTIAALVALNALSLRAAYADVLTEDWNHAALYMSDHVGASDVLTFDPDYARIPFDLYWQRYHLHAREWSFAHGARPQETTQARAARIKQELTRVTATTTTLWLVLRTPSPPTLPLGRRDTWLPARFTLAGSHHFQVITIYWFTARGRPSGTIWRDSAPAHAATMSGRIP